MSYRDKYRIPGYRSLPVSNRSSLLLPSDYNTTNFSEDLSDFDRQFKKLLERTEKFTNRVEKLQSTATYIKKGFRKLDTTVTGIRSQRDCIETAFDSIESRLDTEEYPSTEEEWRRFVDLGILIEKAVEILRHRYRCPKPTFEYSPAERSPYSIDITPRQIISPPRSPTDSEGQRIRDLGSEINHNHPDKKSEKPVAKRASPHLAKRKTDRFAIKLDALTEIEEPKSPTEKNNFTKTEKSGADKKNTRIGRNQSFTSSSIFDDQNNVSTATRQNVNIADDEEISSKGRKKSFLETLKNAATKRIGRSTNDTKEQKLIKSPRKSRPLSSHEGKATSASYDNLANRKTSNVDIKNVDSIKNRNISSSYQNKNEETDTRSKRVGSSSSFHEYNPTNRIPLKERLRLKELAQQQKQQQQQQKYQQKQQQQNLELSINGSTKKSQRNTESIFDGKTSSDSDSTYNSIEDEKRKHSDDLRGPIKNSDVTKETISSLIRKRRQSEEEEMNTYFLKSRKEVSKSESKTSVTSNENNDYFIERDRLPLKERRKNRQFKAEENVNVFPSISSNSSTDSMLSRRFAVEDKDGMDKRRTTSDILRSARQYTEEALDTSLSEKIKIAKQKISITNEILSSVQSEMDHGVTRQKSFELNEKKIHDEEEDEQKNKLSAEQENRRGYTDEPPVQECINTRDFDSTSAMRMLQGMSVVVNEELILADPLKKKRSLILEFQTPQSSFESVIEIESKIPSPSLLSDVPITDTVFDFLSEIQFPKYPSEEEISFVELKNKIEIDDQLFEKAYRTSLLKDMESKHVVKKVAEKELDKGESIDDDNSKSNEAFNEFVANVRKQSQTLSKFKVEEVFEEITLPSKKETKIDVSIPLEKEKDVTPDSINPGEMHTTSPKSQEKASAGSNVSSKKRVTALDEHENEQYGKLKNTDNPFNLSINLNASLSPPGNPTKPLQYKPEPFTASPVTPRDTSIFKISKILSSKDVNLQTFARYSGVPIEAILGEAYASDSENENVENNDKTKENTVVKVENNDIKNDKTKENTVVKVENNDIKNNKTKENTVVKVENNDIKNDKTKENTVVKVEDNGLKNDTRIDNNVIKVENNGVNNGTNIDNSVVKVENNGVNNDTKAIFENNQISIGIEHTKTLSLSNDNGVLDQFQIVDAIENQRQPVTNFHEHQMISTEKRQDFLIQQTENCNNKHLIVTVDQNQPPSLLEINSQQMLIDNQLDQPNEKLSATVERKYGKESLATESNKTESEQLNNVSNSENDLLNFPTECQTTQQLAATDVDIKQQIAITENKNEQQFHSTDNENQQQTILTDINNHQKSVVTDSENNQQTVINNSENIQQTGITEIQQQIVMTESEDPLQTIINDNKNQQQTVITDINNQQKSVVTDNENHQQTVINNSENIQQTGITEIQQQIVMPESEDQLHTVISDSKNKHHTVIPSDENQQQSVIPSDENQQQSVITENANQQQSVISESKNKQQAVFNDSGVKQKTFIKHVEYPQSIDKKNQEQTVTAENNSNQQQTVITDNENKQQNIITDNENQRQAATKDNKNKQETFIIGNKSEYPILGNHINQAVDPSNDGKPHSAYSSVNTDEQHTLNATNPMFKPSPDVPIYSNISSNELVLKPENRFKHSDSAELSKYSSNDIYTDVPLSQAFISTSSPSLCSDPVANVSIKNQIKSMSYSNSVTELSPRIKLGYREKREAHLKMLQNKTFLSNSIPSLLETEAESKVTEESITPVCEETKEEPLNEHGNELHNTVNNSAKEKVSVINEANTNKNVTNSQPSTECTDNTITNDSIITQQHPSNSTLINGESYEEIFLDNPKSSLTCKDHSSSVQVENLTCDDNRKSTVNSKTRDDDGKSTVNSKTRDDDGKSTVNSKTRPVLESQMSIKEYRRMKLERQGTSDASATSDEDVSRYSAKTSSQADVSDLSSDDIERNKKYTHRKKDFQLTSTTSPAWSSSSSLENEIHSSYVKISSGIGKMIKSYSFDNNLLMTGSISEPVENYKRRSLDHNKRQYIMNDTTQDKRNSFAVSTKKLHGKSVEHF